MTAEEKGARLVRAVPAGVALVTAAAFLPSLWNGFVLTWDDAANLTGNPSYRGLGWEQLRWMFGTFHLGPYQPLSWMTLGLDYVLWGMHPAGYHATSLVLHVANAVLAYRLIVVLLGGGRPGAADTPALALAAGAGALLFAVHPLRVESVAWATERRDVVSGLFYLATVLVYLRAQEERRRDGPWLGWILGAVACFAAGLLSKALGMTLPVVLLVLDAYPLGRLATRAGRIEALREKLPFAGLALGAAVVAWIGQQQTGASVGLADYGLLARGAQAAYGLCFYSIKTALPWPLSPLYPIEPHLVPTAPRYVASAVAVTVVTAAAVVLRRRAPWAAAAWASFVILVAPVLGLVQSGPQIAADRYTYLACLPWAVLAAAGLRRLARADGTLPRPALAAAAAALAALGVLTTRYTRVWHDAGTLWAHALRVDPANYVAWTNRGLTRQMEGDLDGALADFDTALRIHPAYPFAYGARGLVRQLREDFGGAVADYDVALHLYPGYADAYYHRATARQAEGDFAGAIPDYDAALALDPRGTRAWNGRGLAREKLGDREGALADYTAAIAANPAYAEPWANRATLRLDMNDLAGAVADYSEAIRRDPGDPRALHNRGWARQALGDTEGAVGDYTRALALAPKNSPAHLMIEYNLAEVRRRLQVDTAATTRSR